MASKKNTGRPLNIILLGDPAAGKATQSALLVKKYRLYDFDMGRELRTLSRVSPALNRKLKITYDKGKLTQTKIVRKILHDRINNVLSAKGILFDGHPKMLGEAKLAVKWLKLRHRTDPVVIYLSIPLEETVRRMADRREYFKGKFSRRTDDTNEALKNRVRYYRRNISQVLKFFESRYPYTKVSGMGTVSQVHKRIAEAIERLKKSAN